MDSTMHVTPTPATAAMRASSSTVISFVAFYWHRYKIIAGNTNDSIEPHTPPT